MKLSLFKKKFFTMKTFSFLLINSIINKVIHISTTITKYTTEYINNLYVFTFQN